MVSTLIFAIPCKAACIFPPSSPPITIRISIFITIMAVTTNTHYQEHTELYAHGWCLTFQATATPMIIVPQALHSFSCNGMMHMIAVQEAILKLKKFAEFDHTPFFDLRLLARELRSPLLRAWAATAGPRKDDYDVDVADAVS
jgi:hypothetical protein